jgi:hypothetical protein
MPGVTGDGNRNSGGGGRVAVDSTPGLAGFRVRFLPNSPVDPSMISRRRTKASATFSVLFRQQRLVGLRPLPPGRSTSISAFSGAGSLIFIVAGVFGELVWPSWSRHFGAPDVTDMFVSAPDYWCTLIA